MSMLVFGAAQPDQGPAVPVRPKMLQTWTGWDGSEWQFTRKAGLWMAPNGIRGFNMPSITHFKRQPASINGSVWYGYLVPEREVFWPLTMAFTEDRDSAFWHTMLPVKTGTWTVRTPNNGARSLDLRFVDDSQHASTGSPFAIKTVWYGVTLAAEQPLWRGVPIFRSWPAPAKYYFHGGQPVGTAGATLAGPPYRVSPSSSTETAQVFNPGDVGAWPKWVEDGPASAATFGIGSDLIEVPFPIVEGERLVIDTDPRVQKALVGSPILDSAGGISKDPEDQVRLTGTITDRTADLGSVRWGMIPAGETVDLSIDITGTPASFGVQFTPLHFRAW